MPSERFRSDGGHKLVPDHTLRGDRCVQGERDPPVQQDVVAPLQLVSKLLP